MNKDDCTPMAPCEPAKRGDYADAITELEVMREVARSNHDVAVSECRYTDAARLRERHDSFRRAVAVLRAVNQPI